MFRSLLSVAAIGAVMAATLVLPTESHARRCGVEIPETLLSLYKGSDVIVIATFDKIEDGESEKTEHYTMVKTKSYYTVATTLKGEQQKMLILEDEDYRYAPDGETTTDVPNVVIATDGEGVAEVEESSEVKPGDSVMMFLKKGQTAEEKGIATAGLEPFGYRDGIKKMSGDVLRTYEHRVNQLNVIFNSAGNRDAAILNWLIDVTEDPITRWEGAFELLQAFQELEWAEAETKRQADAANESSDAETATDAEEAATDDEGEVEPDPSIERQRYAKLMTDGHKQALLNTLLSSVPAKAEGDKPAVASRGDQVLMQLVKNWGDKRLAGFLLEQLRAGSGDPYYKYQLMETIAASLDDDALTAITEEYGDRMYEEDDTVIEREETSGDVVVEEPTSGEPTEGEKVETPVSEGTVADIPEEKRPTYGERRTELVAKFIAAAERRIATEGQ
jgi:hypothetical protein